MKLKVKHQESYSRGELLLRSFFGWLYIGLPHMFVLTFVSLWGAILNFIAFWIILFTGRHPQSMFEFQVGLLRWSLRLYARIWNIADGYPAFGMSGEDDITSLEIEYPEKLSRGSVLVRTLFGAFYVYLPHMFCLMFRAFVVNIFLLVGWFSILFTGRLSESIQEFVVGQLRWSTRVSVYMGYLSDEYPAFTGKELPHEQ